MVKKETIVSFRIPEHLKSEMERVNINWSEFLREKVEERIKLEKIRDIWAEIEEIRVQILR